MFCLHVSAFHVCLVPLEEPLELELQMRYHVVLETEP